MKPFLGGLVAAGGLAVLLPIEGAGLRPCHADVLTATLGQPLREVSHSVEVTLADGVATYQVRRVFANPGTVADEAGLEIQLPFGAAATGLRIRARDRWYDGELMERERAAARYRELTGLGAFQPKDPALLQWLWADTLYLQVFPVLPGQASTVEYTLTVPTRYQGGRVFISYPGLALADDDEPGDRRPLAAPVITVTPAWGDATTRVVVDGLRTAPGAPVVLTSRPEPPWFGAVGGNASYVASALTIADRPASRPTFTRATVGLAIAHTWRSDLRVDLVTPAGDVVRVFDGAGGSDNDVRGRFPVELPAATRAAGIWQLVVSDHAGRDVGTLDAWSLALGSGAGAITAAATDLPRFIPDAPESAGEAGVATIEVAPPPIEVVAARLGKVVASPRHGFARLDLDLAPELRPVPRHARVVFVIDGSHSMGAAGIDAQLAIARAYLSHVPDASAEFVVYRRTAGRLFGEFVAAARVGERLAAAAQRGALAPGNGSALDQGARLAAAALAGTRGPARVVMLGDELLRSRFTSDLAVAALTRLPAGAIVHVVVPEIDERAPAQRDRDHPVTLTRDDHADLSPVAAAHHGILARLAGLPAPSDKQLAAAALGLVRPIGIDRAAVAGLDVDLGDGSLDGDDHDTLREGTGVRVMTALARPPDRVTLTGMIWGDRYRKVVRIDRRFNRAAAGWVFSEDLYDQLSDAEMMAVARLGRAVSPVTSYLATEPGVRPSTAGMRGRRVVVPRISMGAAQLGHGVSGQGVRTPPDLLAMVAGAARACVARHHPGAGWSVTLDVETTKDEIVDVITRPGASGGAPLTSCLVDAVWAVRLDHRFDLTRERFVLAFD